MQPNPLADAPRLLVVAGLLALVGCSDDSPTSFDDPDGLPDAGAVCNLDTDLLATSLPPDRIPALTEPTQVSDGSPEAAYLRPADKVLGLVLNGQPRAYPHNILWHHEIIHDRFGSEWVTVTFCPLTGSGLAFDPSSATGNRLDLGVSGLLYANNLVMYDRESGDIFGPQLTANGRCSGFQGQRLEPIPVVETSWARWKALHPSTTVVGSETGHDRNYQVYPYQSYDQLTNDDLLFPMPVNTQRPIKERVLLARADATAGRGWPFGELRSLGARAAINEEVGGEAVVVFWEAEDDGTAALYRAPTVEGEQLTFHSDGTSFVDDQTGTRWDILGRATEGPLVGMELEQQADSYVLFWFAYAFFQPDATTYGMEG